MQNSDKPKNPLYIPSFLITQIHILVPYVTVLTPVLITNLLFFFPPFFQTRASTQLPIKDTLFTMILVSLTAHSTYYPAISPETVPYYHISTQFTYKLLPTSYFKIPLTPTTYYHTSTQLIIKIIAYLRLTPIILTFLTSNQHRPRHSLLLIPCLLYTSPSPRD